MYSLILASLHDLVLGVKTTRLLIEISRNRFQDFLIFFHMFHTLSYIYILAFKIYKEISSRLKLLFKLLNRLTFHSTPEWSDRALFHTLNCSKHCSEFMFSSVRVYFRLSLPLLLTVLLKPIWNLALISF